MQVERLKEIAAGLGEEELRVLVEIAERLLRAQVKDVGGENIAA